MHACRCRTWLREKKLKRLALLPLALVLFVVGALYSSASSDSVGNANPATYLQDVRALTVPGMEGRGDGTKGLERARHYIERRFRQLGLKPVGTGSYAQPFEVTTGARLRSKNRLEVHANGRSTVMKLNQDYVPLSFSSIGTVTAPVVFAGFGASADEFGYDDYAHVDVKDKIVLVLRYEPEHFAEKSGRQGLTQHSHLITKAINARNRGARAVIVVNGKLGDGEEDLLMKFGSLAGPSDAGILIVQVKNAVADAWLQSAGKSLLELQNQINSEFKPQSFALPPSLRLSLSVDIESTRAIVSNVLGYLPGNSDEYVVIGAHYDHLGRGNASSLAPAEIGHLHPGADDNASGTAGLLQLAEFFAAGKEKLPRGILFAAFAGEELGLLGSGEWVKEPTLSLDKAVAMLNMDMIGRVRDSKLYIGGVGTGSSFKSIVEPLAAKYGFKVSYSSGGYAASDHTSFVGKRIPVLFFFSGLHSDYHKPSDTWEKIDATDAARVVDLVADISSTLASAPERPQFVRVEADMPSAGQGGGGGYGPYFGSIPDFGEIENGVKFADVKPGSPAAKAGLQAGDVLVQFNDKPIKNLYDFTDALRRSKVGEVVDVKVLRNGAPVSAKVKLEQRR